MKTSVIAIANQKGGVGKTTTAVNLSACLVERRCRVLLIDLDPQANATSALGIEKTQGSSLYRPLLGDGHLGDHIRATPYRRFDLVPSEIDLAGAEVDIVLAADYLHRLKRLLEPVVATGDYDFVIIDCPPSLGVLTMNGLTAADAVLIPLQCEYFALEGLGSITGVIEQLRGAGANPGLRIDGIVMTMFDKRTRIAQQVVEEVVKHFPDQVYETLIPRNVRLSEAPSYGKPVIVYDPHSAGAAAYRLLAIEFLKRNQREPSSTGNAETATPAAPPPAPPAEAPPARLTETDHESVVA
jgi:chromosome partitioning protein